jgi:molecular chaperone DnaK
VHVSAQDKGTGKEQSMTITGGSSLSEEDIQRMVKDAEEHAAEDAKRREEAEQRNQAEQLVYATEKQIRDNDAKLPEEVKTEVQADIDALKTALAGSEIAAVKEALEKLMQSQQKLGEAIYAAPAAATDDDSSAESSSNPEDVVDAEVVEDDDDSDGKKKSE